VSYGHMFTLAGSKGFVSYGRMFTLAGSKGFVSYGRMFTLAGIKGFVSYGHILPFFICVNENLSLRLNFFHLLARKSNLENFLFIQTNSFIIFSCSYPVFLLQGFGQVC
jgi:hypothetical protein